MTTLVWRTDTHLADKAPQSRTDDWASTVLDKLAQVGQIAREVGADAVIDGGDFFHIKTPSRTSHALITRVAEVHRGYPCPTYILTGNHDVKYGDSDFIGESPLGVLLSTGVFRPFGGSQEIIFDQVRVCGIPYHGKAYDRALISSFCKRPGDPPNLFVAAHLLASEAGGEMFGSEDILGYGELLPLEPDVWAFGHWHKNQGVTVREQKTIINIGSLTRGSLSEDEVSRIPEVAILRFTAAGVTVERRPLRVRPPEEVFDLVARVKEESRSVTMDAFVQAVHESLDRSSQKPLLEEVSALDLPPEVIERMVQYLESEGAS